MNVTVREVLQLSPLKDAGALVLAGADGLDRPIRWVHVAELPDVAQLLKGGELLLTTGMGIAHDVSVQCKYITELADVGVAGLVIELGRNFREIPTAMVHLAEQRGLPLIALERETRYVEVTEQVHRAIISHQYEMLRRAETVSREFTDLILNGAGIRQIVHRLAEILENPVVLEDAAHQVVELAHSHIEMNSVLAAWEEHSRQGHPETERGRVYEEQGAPRCLWVGIWLRHEAWGRVHVLETGADLDEIAELVLDRAGAALGLALLSQRDAAHLADSAGSALVADLLAGRHGSVGEFLSRARGLGADLTSGRLAAVVLEPTALPEIVKRDSLTEERRQRIRLSLADEIRRAARERKCAVLIGLDADRILAIIAVTKPQPIHLVLEDLVEAVRERAHSANGPLVIVAGASAEVPADSLMRALEEANDALAFGRRTGNARSVFHFGDLGAYQLLLRLAQGPELARFVESELSPLLDHDLRRGTKLVPTLRVYLEHAGRKADAIRTLRIQRRTLYARLERIEKILARDLDAQDTRTRLTLALQGLDLLQDRARSNTQMLMLS
jgi:purine catabolism regulator